MKSLYLDLGLIVVPGVHPPEEAALAMGREVVFDGEGPRRLALASTLHNLDGDAYNKSRFAVFTSRERTIIAPPGGYICSRMGDPLVPLSRRYGEVFFFASYWAQPEMAHVVNGEYRARVGEGEALPPGGFWGVTRKLSNDTLHEVITKAFTACAGEPWEALFPRQGAEAHFFHWQGSE